MSIDLDAIRKAIDTAHSEPTSEDTRTIRSTPFRAHLALAQAFGTAAEELVIAIGKLDGQRAVLERRVAELERGGSKRQGSAPQRVPLIRKGQE